jgi:hypothetical protein
MEIPRTSAMFTIVSSSKITQANLSWKVSFKVWDVSWELTSTFLFVTLWCTIDSLVEQLMSTILELWCHEAYHVNVMIWGVQTNVTQFSCLVYSLSIIAFILPLYWFGILINKDSSTKRLVALGGVRSLVEYVCFVCVYLPGSDDFAGPRRLDSIAD